LTVEDRRETNLASLRISVRRAGFGEAPPRRLLIFRKKKKKKRPWKGGPYCMERKGGGPEHFRGKRKVPPKIANVGEGEDVTSQGGER